MLASLKSRHFSRLFAYFYFLDKQLYNIIRERERERSFVHGVNEECFTLVIALRSYMLHIVGVIQC